MVTDVRLPSKVVPRQTPVYGSKDRRTIQGTPESSKVNCDNDQT
jgi:hypothetical protein